MELDNRRYHRLYLFPDETPEHVPGHPDLVAIAGNDTQQQIVRIANVAWDLGLPLTISRLPSILTVRRS